MLVEAVYAGLWPAYEKRLPFTTTVYRMLRWPAIKAEARARESLEAWCLQEAKRQVEEEIINPFRSRPMSRYLIRTFAIETPDQPTVTIKDDGYYIQASWPMAQGVGSTSIGIRRPPAKPGDVVQATFSLDGKYFYLPGFVRTDPLGGNWMGVDEYATEEEAKEKCQKGIYGPSYVRMTRVKEDNKLVYRELLAFATWKVKEKSSPLELKTTDPAVQDFLAMCMMYDMEDLKRFEESIAFTGRKYGWILDKIGPAPLAAEPLPPVLLTD